MAIPWTTWRSQARATAQAAGISPDEVDRLLEWRSGWSRLDQRLCQRVPPEADLEPIQVLWQARLQQRVPLQYLVGQTAWRDLELQVTPAVLIPRPETELLVDLALNWIYSQPQGGIWLDLGTGSGAIAIALAREAPQITQIYAIDLSAAALQIAQANAARHGVTDRIQFCLGSWFEALPHSPDLRGKIQGMVANPPYIPTAQIPRLQPEVNRHEPHLALDGGSHGLEAIEQLIRQAPTYLCGGGFWAVEIMQGQAPAVRQRLDQGSCYTQIRSHPDLAGIDRVVSAQIRSQIDYSGA